MCILISFKNEVLLAPLFPFKLRLLLCFLAEIRLGWTCFFSGWACVFVFSCRSAQHSGLCRPRWPSSIPHLPKRTEQGRLPDGTRSQTPPITQICHLMPWAGPVLWLPEDPSLTFFKDLLMNDYTVGDSLWKSSYSSLLRVSSLKFNVLNYRNYLFGMTYIFNPYR